MENNILRVLVYPLVAFFLVQLNQIQAQEMRTSDLSVRAEDKRFGENVMEVSYEFSTMFDVGNENDYLMLPQILSWRWQLDEVGNEGWLRGNTEWVTSAYYTPTIEGVESRFTGGLFGPRYNFVQEGWDWVPYIDSRVGFGFTDSRAVDGAQGQDFMFTFAVGVGTRFFVSENVSITLGALYQHFSNAGLSEPDRKNNGLDAVGPNVGLHIRF